MAATMMAQLSPSVHVTEAQQQAMSIAESILASPKATDYHMIKATNMLNDLKIQTVPVPSSDGDSSHEVLSPGSESDPEHCGLFIGDLARNATEDQIRDAFNKFGEVVYAEIKRDKVTGNNLGYGFVQFRHRNEALVAKERMDGVAIGSRPIRLGWAQKNTTLFVGDLDGTVTTQMLIDAFSKHGPLIEQETFVKPGCNFGFVRFQHRNDAERAKQEMNRVTIGTCTIRVGWGESNHQRHCVNLQFDPHLVNPNSLSEALLRSMFEEFGTVVAVNLPRFHDGRLKGFAFIHFKENSEGEKCATSAINAMTDRCIIENVPMKVGYGKKRVGKHSAGRTGRKFRGSFGGGYMNDTGGGGGGGFSHSHSHHHIAHRGGGNDRGGGMGGHSSYHGPRGGGGGGSSNAHPRSQSHNDLHTMSLAQPSMSQLNYLAHQQSHNSPGLVGISHMSMSSGPHGASQGMFPNSSWLAAGPVNPHSYAVPMSPINAQAYTPVALSPYGGGPPVFFPQSPQHASSFGAPSPAMQQPPIHGGLRGGGVMSFASMQPAQQAPASDLGSPTALYMPVGYYSQQSVFFPPSPAHAANPQGFGFGAPAAMQQHAPPPPNAMRFQGQQQYGRMGPSMNSRNSRNGTPSMDHPPQTHPVPPPPLTIAPSSNVPEVTPIPLKPPPLKTE